MLPNSHEALLRRREAGTLTWRGPALMLFARAAFAVGAQAVVAAVFALRASPTPWHDPEPWLPVYGTLIDAGCLTLLWRRDAIEGNLTYQHLYDSRKKSTKVVPVVDSHLLRFAISSFHAAITSASRFIESPLILPSRVAACSSAARVLCQSSVSFAVMASGRNVRPFVSAFAALRRW